MIDPPQITETSSYPTAIIHVVVPQDKIQEVMGPTLEELMAEVARQGIAPAGPWFTHHLTRPADSFDFEVGVPVVRPVTPAGRVQPSEWPAMRVAQTIYHGGYEGLSDGWADFLDWIETNGYEPARDLWEVYVVAPDATLNAAEWLTQLNQPLAD
ncbi:MAG: GyrI-like domain-containing protein [Chthoniobacterales bacterium]